MEIDHTTQPTASEGATDTAAQMVDRVIHGTAEPATLQTLPPELLAHILDTLPDDQRAEAMHRLSLADHDFYATIWGLRRPEGGTTLPIRSQRDLDTAAADPTITRIIIDTDAGDFTFTGSSNAFIEIHGHRRFTMDGTGENHISAEQGAKVWVHSGIVHAHHGNTISGWDTSTVHAHDTSTVNAYGTSTVHAHDTSTVNAYGTGTVYAYDTSTVNSLGTGTVYLDGDARAMMLFPGANLHLSAECRFTAHAPITVTFPAQQGFTGNGPYGGVTG